MLSPSDQVSASLAGIGEALNAIQSELRSLRQENQSLRSEVESIKETQFLRKPLIQPAKFSVPDASAEKTKENDQYGLPPHSKSQYCLQFRFPWLPLKDSAERVPSIQYL